MHRRLMQKVAADLDRARSLDAKNDSGCDELPQLFNVLTGEMSLVGPRPHALAHDARYAALIAGYADRHRVPPGITGWAQVHGWRGETDTLEKMQRRVDHDLAYLVHRSLLLDLRILALTVRTVWRGRTRIRARLSSAKPGLRTGASPQDARRAAEQRTGKPVLR